jgi:hypothetical protein
MFELFLSRASIFLVSSPDAVAVVAADRHPIMPALLLWLQRNHRMLSV